MCETRGSVDKTNNIKKKRTRAIRGTRNTRRTKQNKQTREHAGPQNAQGEFHTIVGMPWRNPTNR